MFSASELARRAGTNSMMVLRMVHRGELRPQARVGKTYLFTSADLERCRDLLSEKSAPMFVTITSEGEILDDRGAGGGLPS